MMSVRMGHIPLMKHSTAITIKMSPMRRIITLLPVLPRMRSSDVDAQRMTNDTKHVKTMTPSITIFETLSGASCMSVITVAIAPGPHSNGMARGVMVILSL